jgi:hypothetical protein
MTVARTSVSISPFGPSDGAQLREFDMVELHATELVELLSSRRSRLVVARSGAGKSCVIKRAHARLHADPGYRVCEEIQRGQPAIAELVAIGERWTSSVRAELWAWIWKAAILRSYASHAMCGSALRQFDEIDGLGFRTTWQNLLRDCAQCTAPVSVFSQIRDIVSNVGSEASFRAYLQNDRWAVLAEDLAKLLERTGTACMIIDLDDDMTAEIPGPWLSCQRGLLGAIHLLNRSPLCGHLTIVATSREQHYTSLVSADKSLMLRDSVLLLDLDEDDTAKYFERMLALIDLREGDLAGRRGLARYVAGARIDNVERGCDEDVDAYLLRHTRSLARDVVVLGNELAKRLARQGGVAPLKDKDVRSVVRGCARLFGNEQLAMCALLLASAMSPEDTVAEYLQSTYATPGGYENPTLRIRLDNVISAIGVDRFPRELLERTRIETTGEFPFDVIEALWRSGLLGYVSPEFQPGHVAFYSLRSSNTEIPHSEEYALHPCLIDALMLDHGGADHPPTTPIADPA